MQEIEDLNNGGANEVYDTPQRNVGLKSLKIEHVQSATYSGPIPHPGLLKGYKEIDESFPERILQMAEKQHAHRIELEKKIVKSNLINERLGMIMGFIIGLLGVGGAIYLVVIGRSISGLSALIVSMVALISVFVAGIEQDRKAKNENTRENTRIDE